MAMMVNVTKTSTADIGNSRKWLHHNNPQQKNLQEQRSQVSTELLSLYDTAKKIF